MSWILPPRHGHFSGEPSPTWAISLAKSIGELSWEPILSRESQYSAIPSPPDPQHAADCWGRDEGSDAPSTSLRYNKVRGVAGGESL